MYLVPLLTRAFDAAANAAYDDDDNVFVVADSTDNGAIRVEVFGAAVWRASHRNASMPRSRRT